MSDETTVTAVVQHGDDLYINTATGLVRLTSDRPISVVSHRCARCHATLDEASVEGRGAVCFRPGDYVRWERSGNGRLWAEGELLSIADDGKHCYLRVEQVSEVWPNVLPGDRRFDGPHWKSTTIRHIQRPGQAVQFGTYQEGFDLQAAAAAQSRDIIDRARKFNEARLKHLAAPQPAPRFAQSIMLDQIIPSPTMRIKLSSARSADDAMVPLTSGVHRFGEVEVEIRLRDNFVMLNVVSPWRDAYWIASVVFVLPEQPVDPLETEYDGRTLRELLVDDEENRREGGLRWQPFTPAQRAVISAHWSAELRARIAAAREQERNRVQMPDDDALLANCRDAE